MTVPFYVSPEQLMRDRADFARKGIARGRSALVLQYADGILLVAENRSPALHKIAEIYDRIGFAAVGRYNEFENLRIAGVRLADIRGYSYDRRDVSGRALANAYAQTLGSIFSSGAEKPLEVELLVAEVGIEPSGDQIYRLTYDGSIADERRFAVMGGSAEQVADFVSQHYRDGISLAGALRLAVDALSHDGPEVRSIDPEQVEVAVLDRTRTQQRKFRRLGDEPVRQMLADSTTDPADAEPPGEQPGAAASEQPGAAASEKASKKASKEAGTEPGTQLGPEAGQEPGGEASPKPRAQPGTEADPRPGTEAAPETKAPGRRDPGEPGSYESGSADSGRPVRPPVAPPPDTDDR